jgi:hypothetical protein
MRANRTWPIVLAVLGVLLLGVAAILAWVVVPDRKQLPADTNTVRDFSGTADVLLDPQAVGTGDMARALQIDVPVTAQRTVDVQATDGDAAQVSDARTLATGAGQPLGGSAVTYAVDRKTLLGASQFPQSWNATKPDGLTITWPIGAEQKDYPVWVNETQTTATAKYTKQEQKNGVDTYVYEVTVPAAAIKDQQVLAALPTALPGTVLGAIAAALPIPDAQKSQLAQLLPTLGAQVPLAYTYESQSTLWVEPTTGIVVDTDRRETRKAGLGSPPIAAAPIYDVTTSFTDQSVAAAADEAADKKGDLDTFGRTLPLILTIVGILALLAALLLWLLGRRNTTVRSDSP